MLVGISAAGIFATNDAGSSWRMYDAGIRYYGKQKLFEKEDLATCVHKMVRDAKDPSIVYQQNHAGMYRRTRGDGAWKIVEKGLPVSKSSGGTFGFPLAAHPHDGQSAYAIPLVGDYNRVMPDGAMAVYRTTNGGKQGLKRPKGLPQSRGWFTLPREGLPTDSNDPAGGDPGATTGQLYHPPDHGGPRHLPAGPPPPVPR